MSSGHTKFIGCLHFGHTSIAKHRGFEDCYEHDAHLIKCWNSVVSHKDLVYILGDITMEKAEPYYNLNLLNGRKIVVLGNHDRRQDVRELLTYVDHVAGMIDYKGYILTHAPVHPNELGFKKGNIHAHIHHINKLEDCVVSNSYLDEGAQSTSTIGKYFNVDAHLIGYKPKTLEEIISNFEV